MVNILCERIRYIVPFMFCSETSYDKLVEEIAKNPLWKIQKMHEQEAEQDLYQMIADCFEMDEKQNNIGCSLHYCMPGNNILEINYTKFKKDFVVSITDLGLYLFRSGVGFLWYEISLPQGATADEIMLFQNEFKELSYERFVSKRRETSVYKGYKQDKIEMRGDRAEMSDFPLYLNTVAGGLDRRDQTIGGFSFVVKIYAVPVVEIIG